jgi:hypothetical protein
VRFDRSSIRFFYSLLHALSSFRWVLTQAQKGRNTYSYRYTVPWEPFDKLV